METVRPDFERPPLAEQAITLIFDRLPGISLVDFGLIWQSFRAEFPVATSQPMREPAVERFDDQVEHPITFKLMPDDAVPRAIFRSESGHEQIQVQPDQFSFNWLQVEDAPYPRSEPLLGRFEEVFGAFAQYVEERELGLLRIVQCELVNVNIIPVVDFGEGYHDADRFFNLPDSVQGTSSMQLESRSFQAQYRLVADDGRPFGRLRQSLVPVLRIEDSQKAYRFELTARGIPDSGNWKDALAFFEKGRNAINATFLASTTALAHSYWGRT